MDEAKGEIPFQVMKCKYCHFENRPEATFCLQCGGRLEITCPLCGNTLPPDALFCDGCGERLAGAPAASSASQSEGERKFATVLFTDLSGYTALSERLDPEEVKDIMGEIFGGITRIVTHHEGCIEKYIGDEVMAFFGLPIAHEDAPVRAIMAAREIHEMVRNKSPQLEGKAGLPLRMHSGIDTGLMVIGPSESALSGAEVTGDTINVASRLTSLAKAEEILVGPETYLLSKGHFLFEELGGQNIKGKAEEVQVYRVLSPRKQPQRSSRSGRSSVFVGRRVESGRLDEYFQSLKHGKGTVCLVSGEAGSGKSRLIKEFRSSQDPGSFQWLEGHSYPYSRNIPYFPLIDLLNRSWKIGEDDPPEKVRERIRSGLGRLPLAVDQIAPYIGSLYDLRSPEVDSLNPEIWKSRLGEIVFTVLEALSQRAPTVVCLEDMHWADPSSLDLFGRIFSEFTCPILFLCIYRPPFSLLSTTQISDRKGVTREISLQPLSPSDTRSMLASLLMAEKIPEELQTFVCDKTEGNPFYMEELISSLLESGSVVISRGNIVRLESSIQQADLPPTIQGIITARVDRLDSRTKHLLQEASVIGRVFSHEILQRATKGRDSVIPHLKRLESLDLVQVLATASDAEYIFRHALIQEVVYGGMLKKERQEMHGRIALIMEELFGDRIADYYETLAYHFSHSRNTDKSIHYLMKSGEKSLKRYAVEEAHRYFRKAFELLNTEREKDSSQGSLLIDLLNKWAFVYHYRGDFNGLNDLLATHESVAVGLNDPSRLGLFYALLGLAQYQSERINEAYFSLQKAHQIGEEAVSIEAIGYACTWLSWVCPELGRLNEAVSCGEKAKKIYLDLKGEDYLFFNSMAGMGMAAHFGGDGQEAIEIGETLLRHGERSSNIRSSVLGHFIKGCGHMTKGHFTEAIESYEKALKLSVDPWYSQFPNLLLGLSYLTLERFEEAEKSLVEVLNYSRTYGTTLIETPARGLMAVVDISRGNISAGLNKLNEVQLILLERGRKFAYANGEYIRGKIFLNAARRSSVSFPIWKNIGFLLKDAPFAARRSEMHFRRCIEVSEEVEAKITLALANMDLGRLFLHKGRKEEAERHLSRSAALFEQCRATGHLEEVKTVMTVL